MGVPSGYTTSLTESKTSYEAYLFDEMMSPYDVEALYELEQGNGVSVVKVYDIKDWYNTIYIFMKEQIGELEADRLEITDTLILKSREEAHHAYVSSVKQEADTLNQPLISIKTTLITVISSFFGVPILLFILGFREGNPMSSVLGFGLYGLIIAYIVMKYKKQFENRSLAKEKLADIPNYLLKYVTPLHTYASNQKFFTTVNGENEGSALALSMMLGYFDKGRAINKREAMNAVSQELHQLTVQQQQQAQLQLQKEMVNRQKEMAKDVKATKYASLYTAYSNFRKR